MNASDLHNPLFLLGAFAIAALIFAFAVLSFLNERKRRHALVAAAESLGLTFTESRDRSLAQRLAFIPDLNEGENRYAYHVITGIHRGHRVTAFDYHFETTRRDSKGNRSTSHHYRNVFVLHLDRDFPSTQLSPEGLFSKIGQALGFDDIDFESAEFSRRFCVRSADRKFAYDFFAPRVMEHFLAHDVQRFAIAGPILAHVRNGRMDPSALRRELDFLGDVRDVLPDYLFAAA